MKLLHKIVSPTLGHSLFFFVCLIVFKITAIKVSLKYEKYVFTLFKLTFMQCSQFKVVYGKEKEERKEKETPKKSFFFVGITLIF